MVKMSKHIKAMLRVRKQQIHELQRALERERFNRDNSVTGASISECSSFERYPVIFRSELDYISRCILDYPNIETGGQLFGYWTESGIPVVMFAIGPGVNANHRTTFFNQDVQYLLTVGNALKSQFGLIHIGEWHSHHQLGLARPSGHDVMTMVSTINEKKLGRFLLCIGNCNSNSSTLNPFMCDERTCSDTKWEIIQEESPLRRPIYARLSNILNDPRTLSASYVDKTLEARTSIPSYSAFSWMRKRESGVLLNQMMNHVKACHSSAADVTVKLDELGRVHIYTADYGRRGLRWEEDIVFPDMFPKSSPLCEVNGITGGPRKIHGMWDEVDDPFTAFVKYYQTIRKQY